MSENLSLFGEEVNETSAESSVPKKAKTPKASQSRSLRAKKSDHAYRTISEVAADLDVATHVLRFWETRFNEIKPMKRAGGRRYYRPQDIDLLHHIKGLLYDEGYTIRGVQAHLKKKGKPEAAQISAKVDEVKTPIGDGTQKKIIKSAISELREMRDILAA